MSKLNPSPVNTHNNIVKVAAKRSERLAVSANGNLQFAKQPLQMLYELVVQTLLGKAGQLKSAAELVNGMKTNLRQVVELGQYDFIANLAIHARSEMNIRTIPIVLVVEFAKALADSKQSVAQAIHAEEALLKQLKLSKKSTATVVANLAILKEQADRFTYANMRNLVCDVIQRADQITDLYAYALTVFGDKKKIPMAIKRGVADAFNKFGEYAFAKYDRSTEVKFRDVLRIVHPTAKSVTQGAIFAKIMADNLDTPYTWETELSTNGQKPVAERLSDKQLWTQLVTSGKVGYMALLRNLRNIHNAGLDSDVLKKHVIDVIADPVRVAKSKQLPYDFVEAYNIIRPYDAKLATAISKAIDASVNNIPQMGERVWLIIDYSGSMGMGETSAFSSAMFLASALLKANADSDKLAITIFGAAATTLNGVDTNNSMLALQNSLASLRTGAIAGSTNFGAALAQKSQIGFEPDTIVVLSDGEVDGFPYGAVRTVAGRDVVKLAVNLSAANSTPLSKNDGWYALAGWSPAMFRWIPAIRNKESVTDQLCVPYQQLQTKVAFSEEEQVG